MVQRGIQAFRHKSIMFKMLVALALIMAVISFVIADSVRRLDERQNLAQQIDAAHAAAVVSAQNMEHELEKGELILEHMSAGLYIGSLLHTADTSDVRIDARYRLAEVPSYGEVYRSAFFTFRGRASL